MTYLSGYRIMWTIILFDAPTKTTKQQKQINLFRKNLLEQGFYMMQYSVYIRYAASKEHAEQLINQAIHYLPPEANIEIIMITDKQYENIRTYQGKQGKQKRENPQELTLF